MKKQSITFIISQTPDGNQSVELEFSPQLATDIENFNQLPADEKTLQNAASEIANIAMMVIKKRSAGNS